MRWSDQAKADLRAIHNFIARDSTHYAKKVIQDVVEKADTLLELPRLGRVVPELGEDRVREIPSYSNTLGFMFGSAAWQMFICLALFAGCRANDGEDQLFSRAISRWGRLTLSREARTQNFLVNPTLTT